MPEIARVEEAAEGLDFGPLQSSQIGPAYDQVTGEPGGEVWTRQIDHGREVVFEGIEKLFAQAGAFVNGLAPILHEQSQVTCLHIIRFPVGESIAMLLEQFEQEVAIEQIALGTALLKSFAQAGQGGGVEQGEGSG